MVGTSRGNRKANKGGQAGEQVAQRTFRKQADINGVKRKQAKTVKGRLDGTLKGKPVDVKSCRTRIKNGNGWRKGRFKFNKKQHRILLRNDDNYILVSRRSGKNSRVAVIPAKDVPDGGGKPEWTVTYDILMKRGKTLKGRFRGMFT